MDGRTNGRTNGRKLARLCLPAKAGATKTLIFFVEKMREAFALQKLLTFFQQKILAYLRY